MYGGVQGEQLDPCYHEACDTYSTVTGQPPASTMNTYATNPVLAQQQADSLNGNALRSLEQFKGTLVHAVWYFARVKDAFPSKATTAKAKTAPVQVSGPPARSHALTAQVIRRPGRRAEAAIRREAASTRGASSTRTRPWTRSRP